MRLHCRQREWCQKALNGWQAVRGTEKRCLIRLLYRLLGFGLGRARRHGLTHVCVINDMSQTVSS